MKKIDVDKPVEASGIDLCKGCLPPSMDICGTLSKCPRGSKPVEASEDARKLVSEIMDMAIFDEDSNWPRFDEAVALITADRERIREETRREDVEKGWPLLKQEYGWRHEDSECGGDEISEGLDMLKARLTTAIMGKEAPK